MKKVKLNIKHNSALTYYLLTPKKISIDNAKSLIQQITGETNFTLISEQGVTATDNDYVIIGKNPKTHEVVSILYVENENDFDILE